MSVSKGSELLRAAEATARAIIDAEFVAWETWSIDDDEHIPRIHRIAAAAGDAADTLGVSVAAAGDMVKRLLQHAEDEYVNRCMTELEIGEDPESVLKFSSF